MSDYRQSKSRRSSASNFAVTMVIAGLVCVAVAVCLTRLSNTSNSPPLPFVWTDVAIVYLLGALPLAGLLCCSLGNQLRWPLAGVLGGSVLLGMVLALPQRAAGGSDSLDTAWSAGGGIARNLLGLIVACSAVLLARSIVEIRWPSSREPNMTTGSLRRNIVLFLIALVFATLVPAAYTRSRVGYFQDRLGELVTQYRLGQAERLAGQLLGLAPGAHIDGQPIRSVAGELSDRVRAIEHQLSQSRAAADSLSARLERARLFAILGNVEDAQKTLDPLVQSAQPHPAACLLLGTAYESREDWRTSRSWYERARTSLQELGPPPQALPALLQATKGIAYAERKLGRYPQAEAAYLEALRLSPTADLHFLLAQFYDDGQQAAKAHEHALLAAQQAPNRYATASEKLIDKLATHQFGCLSVFFRDRKVVSISVGPTR